jgi:hypothetical protein
MTDVTPLVAEIDPFWAGKFENGEMRPGWNYVQWTLDRCADIPRFPTANCNTTKYH